MIRKILFILWVTLSSLHADYMMSSEIEIYKDPKVAVIEATVTAIMENGEVHLNIHSIIHGNDPSNILTNTYLTCVPASPSIYGVKSNRKYILIVREDMLYEESTHYEIQSNGKSNYLSIPFDRNKVELSIVEIKEHIKNVIKSSN